MAIDGRKLVVLGERRVSCHQELMTVTSKVSVKSSFQQILQRMYSKGNFNPTCKGAISEPSLRGLDNNQINSICELLSGLRKPKKVLQGLTM